MQIKIKELKIRDPKKHVCVGAPSGTRDYPPADRVIDLLIDADRLVGQPGFSNYDAIGDLFEWALEDLQIMVTADEKDRRDGYVSIEIRSTDAPINETSLEKFLTGFCDIKAVFFKTLDPEAGCFRGADETPSATHLKVWVLFNN